MNLVYLFSSAIVNYLKFKASREHIYENAAAEVVRIISTQF